MNGVCGKVCSLGNCRGGKKMSKSVETSSHAPLTKRINDLFVHSHSAF